MRLHELPYFMTFMEFWDELDLSENFLDHLPKSAFSGVRARNLNLSRNNINSIDAHAFDGVIGVNGIDLSHNKLRTIPKMFSSLVQLHTLKLCYNQIKTFKYDTFDGSHLLHELDLTGNDIESIPTEAFLSIQGLRHLILRHNRLEKIDAYAFHDLPIEVLDLGDNGAPLAIHEEAFCGLQPTILRSEPGVIDWSGMHTLLLDHNGLSSLNPCVTGLIWTIHTVDISGNPLHCNCDIFSLREFGTKAVFPGAQCASPEKFAGSYINTVNKTRYNCPTNRTAHNCKRLCHSPPPAAYRGKAEQTAPKSKHITLYICIALSCLVLL